MLNARVKMLLLASVLFACSLLMPVQANGCPSCPKGKPATTLKKANPKKAVVRVVGASIFTAADGRKYGHAGSGTIIGPKVGDKYYVLSAQHVVHGYKEMTVVLDGKEYKAKVELGDVKTDVAWLSVRTKKELPFALLATAPAVRGDVVWHKGFGVDKPGNVERGHVTYVGRDNLATTVSVDSGDSGAALFNTENRVVGVACWKSAMIGPGDGGGPTLVSILRLQEKLCKCPLIPECKCGCEEGKTCRCANK